MKQIRIGIDISMTWAITTNGEPKPLAGRDLTLIVTNPIGVQKEISFTSEGNVAKFTFPGMEQTRYGKYSLTMWENRNREGQNAVDVVDAFECVHPSDIGGEDDGNITTEFANLSTSDFSFGGAVYDDTEIRQEIADVRQLVEDTHLIGATSIGGGGANENDFVK